MPEPLLWLRLLHWQVSELPTWVRRRLPPWLRCPLRHLPPPWLQSPLAPELLRPPPRWLPLPQNRATRRNRARQAVGRCHASPRHAGWQSRARRASWDGGAMERRVAYRPPPP
eukprot:scaffold39887_cov63-Phaeocystis_antarctica.AAC.1